MLAEAIASIKAQTVAAHEIIVVDYPDETFGNQSRRLNHGVKQSTGTHYFFMGDDDKLMPNFIEAMTEAFAEAEQKYSKMDIITSGFQNFGEEKGIHVPAKFPLASTVVSREIYDKTKGYDEAIPIGIDADFYFQCFELGAKWKVIPHTLYLSRVHKEQYSRVGNWGNYKKLIRNKYNGKYENY